MDTLAVALVVVVIVFAIVVAALLHERSQVAMARRNAQYARARQVYEARKAIILAQRAAAGQGAGQAAVLRATIAHGAHSGAGMAAAGTSTLYPPTDSEGFPLTDGFPASSTRRYGLLRRRRIDDSLPTWVFRPLRPGEDPRIPWWVRLRGIVGLSVLVAILAVAFTGILGAVFLFMGLLLERFAS